MTEHIRKRLSPEDLDNLRINLSVLSRKLSSEPVCDFCGSPDPVFIYAGPNPAGELQWRWCACDPCADAVENDQLEERLVECFAAKLRVHREALLDNVRESLEEFQLYYRPLNSSFN